MSKRKTSHTPKKVKPSLNLTASGFSHDAIEQSAKESGRDLSEQIRITLGNAIWSHIKSLRAYAGTEPLVKLAPKGLHMDSDTLRDRVTSCTLDRDTRDKLCHLLNCNTSDIPTGDELVNAFTTGGQAAIDNRMIRLLRASAPIEYDHIMGLVRCILIKTAIDPDELWSIVRDQRALDEFVEKQ